MNEYYKPTSINSIDDVKQNLTKNLEAYKEETKYILSSSDFKSSQLQDLEDVFRQYYYALADIVKAIEIIAKNTPK